MNELVSLLGQLPVGMVFVEGLLSFLSPCVLPLLPVYMGYLAGGEHDKQHTKGKVLRFTLSFIFGIFFAIFLMNASIHVISSFFQEHMTLMIRIGAVFIILLGLYQFGFLESKMLSKTVRLPMKMKKQMNILTAFLMGFTFSFAWTPCIGPALSSILILAGSSQNFLLSNFLMLVYALGFTIPFLLLGFFTEQLLQWFSTHRSIMKYTTKLGAVVLVLIGLMMFTGKMNPITNYISASDSVAVVSKDAQGKEEDPYQLLLQHELKDQQGNSIALSDYQGKVVFLNFWATWCPPCRVELPHVQDLYEKYKDSEDVAILTVVLPGGKEKNAAGIKTFITEEELSMPVLFDDGTLYGSFQISSMPTTIMLKKDGTAFGHVKGAMSADTMESIIQKTLADAN